MNAAGEMRSMLSDEPWSGEVDSDASRLDRAVFGTATLSLLLLNNEVMYLCNVARRSEFRPRAGTFLETRHVVLLLGRVLLRERFGMIRSLAYFCDLVVDLRWGRHVYSQYVREAVSGRPSVPRSMSRDNEKLVADIWKAGSPDAVTMCERSRSISGETGSGADGATARERLIREDVLKHLLREAQRR